MKKNMLWVSVCFEDTSNHTVGLGFNWHSQFISHMV